MYGVWEVNCAQIIYMQLALKLIPVVKVNIERDEEVVVFPRALPFVPINNIGINAISSV